MKMVKFRVLSYLLLMVLPTLTSASRFDDADRIFRWAEITYPSFFIGESVGSLETNPEQWYYRYYPESNVYAGYNINTDDIWVLGGVYNTPFRVSDVDSLLNNVNLSCQQIDDLSLQITTTNMQVSSNEGDDFPISFEGTWDAAELACNSVYVRAQDEDSNVISSAIMDVTDNQSFRVNPRLNHLTPPGNYTSTITFVACRDRDCDNQYENSTITINMSLLVEPVPEWQTHQANALHNGYMPIWISGNNFSKLWEWSRSPLSEPLGGINAPVAGNGEVYLSIDVNNGNSAVIALDELTGEENWRVSFGNVPALNPPAINNSSLFVATSGHGDTKVWGINREDGKLKFQSNFSAQWSSYLAPTVDEEIVYQTGGYYGGYTYAFSVQTGAEVWTNETGSSWGMDTPAIDDKNVYVHSGSALTVLDKDNGEIKYSIDDPFGNYGYDYHGAPVKGSSNNILAFSGGASSGYASSSAEHNNDRVISSFGVEDGQYNWSSQFVYKTFFAVSGGVVYAGKNNPTSIDAIDETSGDILWSWVAPTTDDTAFHRNVVVTKNVLFVSTNANIYAIDLKSKQAIWSYSEPGMMTISDNRILLLATGASRSDGRLIAFDLRSN